MQTPVEFGGPMEYLAAFAVAAVLSGLLTPLMRRIALRCSVLDGPDGGRKLQSAAVPYLGGLAILLAVCVVTVGGATLVHAAASRNFPTLLGVLAPAVLLGLVGLIDDIRGLGPLSRFIIQGVAAAATCIPLTLTGTGVRISDVPLLDFALTVFWVVGVTNAINLLDNTDGVAAGVSGIAALTYGLVAGLNGQYLVASLALSLAGACAGFLVWNRYPASIYMGDAGALFIGFLLAAIGIRINLQAIPHWQATGAIVLVLAVPVLDTALVIVSRTRRGQSPFVGGLDHVAHRLRRLGRGVGGTASLLWAVSAVAGASAVSVSVASSAIAALVLGFCAVAFVAALVFFGRLPDSGDLS